MKILILSTNADEAGAPRHVETIVNGLEDKFQFILVFGESGPVSDRILRRGHVVHILKEMRTAISPIKDLIALIKLLILVVNCRPDVIHCHSAKAGMLGRMTAALSCIPWIYTVHGWGWRGLPKAKGVIITAIERLLKYVPYGTYIFVARDVLNEAIKVVGVENKKVEVIYNGTPDIGVRVRKNDQKSYTIMMPARVSPAKDHVSLISSFELLDEDASRLLLCGAGTDTEDFIAVARVLAPKRFLQISFLGQRSDMGEIYSQCDVVALISKFEALPLSIIESMSCNLPIIATAVGGVPELISHGINGTLVKPGGIDEIVDALRKYKNPSVRTHHGYNARRTYEKFFTERAMLASITNTYHARGRRAK
jgi:glycosyltransferase involved in cell wall biosynthesis